MLISRFLTGLALAAVAFGAQAIERPFPAQAKRGVMTLAKFPTVYIDGQERKLSAGARIWNQNNMIQMPASIRGTDMTIHYTEAMQGNVIDRIWILTEAEIAKPAPKPVEKPSLRSN